MSEVHVHFGSYQHRHSISNGLRRLWNVFSYTYALLLPVCMVFLQQQRKTVLLYSKEKIIENHTKP